MHLGIGDAGRWRFLLSLLNAGLGGGEQFDWIASIFGVSHGCCAARAACTLLGLGICRARLLMPNPAGRQAWVSPLGFCAFAGFQSHWAVTFLMPSGRNVRRGSVEGRVWTVDAVLSKGLESSACSSFSFPRQASPRFRFGPEEKAIGFFCSALLGGVKRLVGCWRKARMASWGRVETKQ